MTIDLPKPIQMYFESENAHDVEALDGCFASNGVVRDEAQTIEGLSAIKTWRLGTAAKYSHSVEPLRLARRNGRTVVTARVEGNFPGSPVNLDHIFELDGDKIVSLEIH